MQRNQLVSTTTHFLATLRGTQEIMAHQDLLHMERKPWAASLPTDLACTTCQAMFLSGAKIGIAVLTTPRAHLQTPQDPRLARPVCCAAATGASTPASAARRSATATRPAASTSTSASVSRGLRNFIYPCRLRQAEPASIFHLLFFLFTSPNLGVRHGLVATKAAGCRAVSPTGCGKFLKSNDLVRGLRRGGLAYCAAFANPQFVTPLFTGKNRSFLDHFRP